MVDRVDALRAQFGDDIEKIQGILKIHSNKMFSSEFVEAFLKISKHISFWFFLEDEALGEYCQDWIDTGRDEEVPYKELKEIALMFASVFDAKSKFTSEHSLGVSSLVRYYSKNV
ncbi:MAG: hypothetical protein U9N02_08305 [Campylobacterota bacterium]|nr:hypothetical protein [Campylobacterota bacterium]